MDFQNAIGIPYGTNDTSKRDLLFVRDTISFATGEFQISYNPGISGRGSARWKYDWQTLYIDNADRAFRLEVMCYGTLHRFTAPPRSQGYYVLACPEGSFGLVFSRPNADAAVSIPIGLFSGEIGPSVWQVGPLA